MKKYLSILVGVCLVSAATAQRTFILSRQDKRGFITATAGPSWAVSIFTAHNTPANSKVGLAGQGFAAQVTGGFRLTRLLGLSGAFTQTRNQIMTGLLVKQAARQNLGKLRIVKAGHWEIRSLMVGPYLTFPFNRFSVDLRGQGGYAFSTCPAMVVQGTLNTQPLELRTPSYQSQAFAFGGGTTFRYRLGTSWAIQINADYLQTKFSYKDMISSARIGDQNIYNSQSGTQPLHAFNLTVGLTFLFANRRVL